MTVSARISAARLAMLRELAEKPQYYAEYWPPLRWGLAKGYVGSAPSSGGCYFITDLGRAVLEGEEGRA